MSEVRASRSIIKQGVEMSVGAIAASSRLVNRWWQLGFGVICMMLIANLQYSWTLFVNPLSQANHWEIAEVQLAFVTKQWLWFSSEWSL